MGSSRKKWRLNWGTTFAALLWQLASAHDGVDEDALSGLGDGRPVLGALVGIWAGLPLVLGLIFGLWGISLKRWKLG